MDVLRLLIEHNGGVDVNAAGATSFLLSTAVQLLLLHGADRSALESKGHDPACLAAMDGHVAATQALLSGCSRSETSTVDIHFGICGYLISPLPRGM